VRAALRLQKRLRLLAATIGVCTLMACAVGCNSYDYRGTPVGATPWDGQWRRVEKAVREAARISFKSEARGDYWQTPQETARLGTGDCEDLSIWLYARLLREGVKEARVCIGKRGPGDRDLHCWVVWLSPETTYILDPSTAPHMSKASTWLAGYYKPYYSYDLEQKYAHRAHISPSSTTPKI